MEKQIVYKVPGGKLLKISLSFDETTHKIKDIMISGDFFAYPEESIEDLEQVLKERVLDAKELHDVIGSFIKDHDVEFIGVDASTLTDAILEALA
jgi:lipoate---protein ligase